MPFTASRPKNPGRQAHARPRGACQAVQAVMRLHAIVLAGAGTGRALCVAAGGVKTHASKGGDGTAFLSHLSTHRLGRARRRFGRPEHSTGVRHQGGGAGCVNNEALQATGWPRVKIERMKSERSKERGLVAPTLHRPDCSPLFVAPPRPSAVQPSTGDPPHAPRRGAPSQAPAPQERKTHPISLRPCRQPPPPPPARSGSSAERRRRPCRACAR